MKEIKIKGLNLDETLRFTPLLIFLVFIIYLNCRFPPFHTTFPIGFQYFQVFLYVIALLLLLRFLNQVFIVVTINEKGIEKRSLLSKQHFEWSEIKAFEVELVLKRRTVTLNKNKPLQAGIKTIHLSKNRQVGKKVLLMRHPMQMQIPFREEAYTAIRERTGL